MPYTPKGVPSDTVIKRLPRLEYFRQLNASPSRKEYRRAWNKAHPRTHEDRAKEYAKVREKQVAIKKSAYFANPEKFKQASKCRREQRTPEQILADCEYQRNYRKSHIRELSDKRRIKISKRIDLRVLRNLRGRIAAAISRKKYERVFVKKCANTKSLIGCSINRLLAHIESKWLPGMTWENHGQMGWHIDHILPCDMFDMTDEAQQRACFHYTNLQPLWWLDNIRKGAKIIPQSK